MGGTSPTTIGRHAVRPRLWRCAILLLIVAVVGCAMGGCGATSPTVDDGPFREAIKQYLRQRDMALAIKQIKSGPEVTGETAVLTASMTHKDLPGPAVTWKVFFQKDAGKWRVARHEK